MDRLNTMTPPYYYIGSKSNCKIKGGVIFSSNGREYWGSSRYNGYPFKSEGAIVKVLKDVTGAEYSEIIKKEYAIQKQFNVVESPDYFNLSYATVNSFSEPGYSVYRHKNNPNKIIRLKTDDYLVESREYIHINTNVVKDESVISNWVEKVASKPKSSEHRRKIGRKDMIMLQHIDTLEVIRVSKTKAKNLDSKWVNPRLIIPEKKCKCLYCGKESIAGNIKRWHNENCKFKETGKYVDCSKIRTTNRKRIPVIIDGVEYKSINSASIALGVSKYEIKKHAAI